MKLRFAFAAACLFGTPVASTVVAHADETLTVTCNRSRLVEGQVSCDKHALYRFQAESADHVYGLELTAPSSHCSPVQYRILENGSRTYLGSTRFLQPGQSQLVELGNGFVPGTNKVMIVAWGKVEGCNTGVLQSWAVQVHPVALR